MAFGPNKNPSESSRRAIEFGLGTRINGHAEAPRRASGRDRGKPLRKPLEPTKKREPPNRIHRGRPAAAEEGASPQQTNARRKPNQVRDRKEPGAKSSQQGRDRHHDEGGILAKTQRGRQDPTEPTTEPPNKRRQTQFKGCAARIRQRSSSKGANGAAGVYGRRPAATRNRRTKIANKNVEQKQTSGSGATRN